MGIPILPSLPTLNSIKISSTPVENTGGSGSVQKTKEKEQAQLKQACQDFESVFLNYLLSKMRETVPKTDLTGENNGEEIYRSMLDTELSKRMSASGGVGLADMMYRQLKDRI